MSLWISRHVLCTTELYCQFLNPVVADCTCSTVLVFFGSQGKGKAVPVPCRHKRGLEVQLPTFFEVGEWSASRLGCFTPIGYAHSAGRFRFRLRFRELAPVRAIMFFVGGAIQTV